VLLLCCQLQQAGHQPRLHVGASPQCCCALQEAALLHPEPSGLLLLLLYVPVILQGHPMWPAHSQQLHHCWYHQPQQQHLHCHKHRTRQQQHVLLFWVLQHWACQADLLMGWAGAAVAGHPGQGLQPAEQLRKQGVTSALASSSCCHWQSHHLRLLPWALLLLLLLLLLLFGCALAHSVLVLRPLLLLLFLFLPLSQLPVLPELCGCVCP
jgi:hypothetical protein